MNRAFVPLTASAGIGYAQPVKDSAAGGLRRPWPSRWEELCSARRQAHLLRRNVPRNRCQDRQGRPGQGCGEVLPEGSPIQRATPSATLDGQSEGHVHMEMSETRAGCLASALLTNQAEPEAGRGMPTGTSSRLRHLCSSTRRGSPCCGVQSTGQRDAELGTLAVVAALPQLTRVARPLRHCLAAS